MRSGTAIYVRSAEGAPIGSVADFDAAGRGLRAPKAVHSQEHISGRNRLRLAVSRCTVRDRPCIELRIAAKSLEPRWIDLSLEQAREAIRLISDALR